MWSSARQKNITPLLEQLLDKGQTERLVFVWHQSHCQEEPPLPQDPKKPVFLKPLSKLWTSFPKYENYTLLIDDSPIKARVNPPNTAIHPREWTRDQKADSTLAEQGYLRQYLIALASDDNTVARFVASRPFNEPV